MPRFSRSCRTASPLWERKRGTSSGEYGFGGGLCWRFLRIGFGVFDGWGFGDDAVLGCALVWAIGSFTGEEVERMWGIENGSVGGCGLLRHPEGREVFGYFRPTGTISGREISLLRAGLTGSGDNVRVRRSTKVFTRAMTDVRN